MYSSPVYHGITACLYRGEPSRTVTLRTGLKAGFYPMASRFIPVAFRFTPVPYRLPTVCTGSSKFITSSAGAITVCYCVSPVSTLFDISRVAPVVLNLKPRFHCLGCTTVSRGEEKPVYRDNPLNCFYQT